MTTPKPREWLIEKFTNRARVFSESGLYSGDEFHHVVEHNAYLKAITALKFYGPKDKMLFPIDDGGALARDLLKELGET